MENIFELKFQAGKVSSALLPVHLELTGKIVPRHVIVSTKALAIQWMESVRVVLAILERNVKRPVTRDTMAWTV